VAFVVIVVGLVAGVFAAGWSPLLGLDLQGGVAVVLKPSTPADPEQLAQAVAVIRNRVDAIGVAEPDITTQGGNVVVQLPGVKDRERALELVGSTAELRFRPVIETYPNPDLLAQFLSSTTTVKGATTAPTTTAPTTDSTVASSSTSSKEQSMGSGTGEQAAGPLARRQSSTTTPTATTVAPASTVAPTSTLVSATTVVAATETTTSSTLFAPGSAAPAVTDGGNPLWPDLTPRDADTNDAFVVLSGPKDKDGKEQYRYRLGPTLVTGDALVAADTKANLRPDTGEWLVQLNFKEGDDNVGAWREAAAACYRAANPNVCPSGQLAAVLDGAVISAPQIQSTFDTGTEAVITGQFTQEAAKDLAQKLRYGALPVEFERQQSQDVSATIGRDALRAGVAAGLIGLAIVAIYILLFYRILGLVALASLTLSFGLLWAIIAYLGESRGLALSLSGVVGIIVSIGVSIDSNIVYFEQIKDDMVSGRTMRSSSQRAFQGAMSTIIKADLVSLIGAALLYWLTVGPVKGFALYLGLSTLLDLVASYFFMRPAVLVLSRTRLAATRPAAFGIRPSSGHGSAGVTA